MCKAFFPRDYERFIVYIHYPKRPQDDWVLAARRTFPTRGEAEEYIKRCRKNPKSKGNTYKIKRITKGIFIARM